MVNLTLYQALWCVLLFSGETVDLTSGTGIPLRPGTVPHRGDARQCPLEHAAAFFR